MLNDKLIITGKLELLSPLAIGSGFGENADDDVLVDFEGRPYIPATSLAGVLKAYTSPLKNEQKKLYERLWGDSEDKKDSTQSFIICSDLRLETKSNDLIEIRDGIKLDSKNGIVEAGAKFDFEVVKAGTLFNLRIEITLKEKLVDKDDAKRFAATLVNILNSGELSLGSRVNLGLGRVKGKDLNVFEYNLHKIEHLVYWLKNKNSDDLKVNMSSIEPFKISQTNFVVDLSLKMRGSFIIRSYSERADMPDATHLKSAGKNVISGASIKGALRSRGEKILNTLFDESAEKRQLLHDLFGTVLKKKSVPSRLSVDEVFVENVEEEAQSRICIDRFTGGVLPGALFDTMPLFPKKGDSANVKNFRITVKPNHKGEILDSDKGLVLLIVKDLITGDIAIGGEKSIGRGTFDLVDMRIDGVNVLKEGLSDWQKYVEKLIDESEDTGMIIDRLEKYGLEKEEENAAQEN